MAKFCQKIGARPQNVSNGGVTDPQKWAQTVYNPPRPHFFLLSKLDPELGVKMVTPLLGPKRVETVSDFGRPGRSEESCCYRASCPVAKNWYSEVGPLYRVHCGRGPLPILGALLAHLRFPHLRWPALTSGGTALVGGRRRLRRVPKIGREKAS